MLNALFLLISLLSSLDLNAEAPPPFTKQQQALIDNMQESLRKKKTSEEYNKEFARLLVEKHIKGALLKISTTGNGSCTYETVINYIPPAESEDRISSTVNIIKKYLGGFSLKEPIVFFVPVMDFFHLFNDDFHIFDPELEKFIADHIIILAPENLLASQKCFTLIPDFFILKSFQEKIDSVNRQKVEVPFEARKPVAKFIGSASGRRPYLPENINLIPRLKAFSLSKSSPELLEIDFSYYTASDEYLKLNYGPYSPWMPHEQLLYYRYLLSFDGYTSAWERPEIIMHSGSVPLFQTRFEKFWTILLQDDVNYIKIQDDLSNLVASAKSLNDRSEHAKEIAKQAQLLADDVLTAEFFNTYMTELFKEVARVQMSGD